MKFKKNELVEKRNVLNEMRTNGMSLQALRFFSIYLAKINARDVKTRLVRFPLDDFQKIMELNRPNISFLEKATNELLQQIVRIPNENGIGFNSFQLFKECKVSRDENGEWYVEIDAHDKALNLMFDFKSKYFTYNLWNALKLKSVNQLRMYEFLKQYEFVGKKEITIKDLKEMLGITPDEYPRMDNFKTRVLDSCQKALEENTDICFTYEKGKSSGKGGKWISIIFHITKNKNEIDTLSLSKFIDLKAEKEKAYKEEKIYECDSLELLAEACDNEFTKVEMELIFSILITKDIIPHPDGIHIARFHYLKMKYAELNYRAYKTKVNNRFLYFKKILEESE